MHTAEKVRPGPWRAPAEALRYELRAVHLYGLVSMSFMCDVDDSSGGGGGEECEGGGGAGRLHTLMPARGAENLFLFSRGS